MWSKHPAEQRQWRKPRQAWEISQGKKTKAAKFKRERKAVSAGPAASINTWMAVSSRKKGGIIPCLPRCRTRPEATRKPGPSCGPQGNKAGFVPGEELGSEQGRGPPERLLADRPPAGPRGRLAGRDHQSLARLLSADLEESRWREGALWLWASKPIAGLPSRSPFLATVSLFVKWGSLLVTS